MGTEKGRSKETRLLRGVGKAILACQDAGRASKTRVCGYTFVPLCVSGCVCMPVSVSCVSIYVFVCTHIRVRVCVPFAQFHQFSGSKHGSWVWEPDREVEVDV